ncbi:rhodanese-like domain-containing protein [Sneathiella aquimaris]|uniref:rhodanese-like domain-containing protein n=1 Tax=Sneathiella aquimaris TaxID=2599305 RepID=UPI00146C4DD4|nr:rhodanese-like domain-containing protein [Sneathiella aquimaris]
MTADGTQTQEKQYAGDITVHDAWDLLKSNPEAVLVDVRTNAEWGYVGLPDLSPLNKKTHTISWVLFPDMSVNPHFIEQLKAAQENPESPVLFLCRSGVRSIAAAIAATNAGFTESYNILGGFEGDLDENRHRGTQSGWKAENLSWVQG